MNWSVCQQQTEWHFHIHSATDLQHSQQKCLRSRPAQDIYRGIRPLRLASGLHKCSECKHARCKHPWEKRPWPSIKRCQRGNYTFMSTKCKGIRKSCWCHCWSEGSGRDKEVKKVPGASSQWRALEKSLFLIYLTVCRPKGRSGEAHLQTCLCR